ncbi:Tc toxin subunit A [Pseudomonas sp. GD04058]|uniref:Tc toxin subunit A n=1 Tax=Pseudomonas sp. GD04058 TaxID=2975429 RepID=UPI002447C59E|nr:Tc toxin subunit A [Pseudomonas sp. GD04058]MDG9885129.1 Tc toxin subunit A [Pseudomonas sp. GD04058]
MARRKVEPASNPLSRIASGPEQAEQLLQAGLDSAFAIARDNLDSLMRRLPGLSRDEARRLHQRASTLAVLAARHYREQRLTAAEKTNQPWRTGLRLLVDGPNFENQFSPSWDENCPPGSIEATTSPAAYLTALYQWVTQVIEPQANTEEDTPIPLAQRRPDLAGLVLDNQALERVEPTIGIVNEILDSAARKHLDDHNLKTFSVDDALLQTRYPFKLPFERYMSQINGILHSKGFGLGDLVRQLDPEFPYFCRGGLHSVRSDDALQLDTALGPEQRSLLLEAAYFPRGARRASTRSIQTRTNPRSLLRESLHSLQAGFFMRHFGVAKAEDLLPLSAFCLRTALNQDGVESLLSIQRCAPVASPNVPGLAAPTPARFGSVYINAATEPAIGVSTVDKEHSLSDWTNDHFDRMQRMVRLARWLEVSYGEADQLLDAALQAEYGDEGRGREITENTLRALGLFRRLRRDFKIGAEDFAALLQGLALYARGSEVPQFDRVFNDPTLFSEPLVLDGRAFSIVPDNDADYKRVQHLCAALGLDFETYLYLARYIAQAWGDEALSNESTTETLYWSHAVVSAFYRLARLPAWLGLTSIEALALLQLVGEGGHHYVSRLVRTRLSIHQHSELSDTLSVIQSLADAAQWCREHDLTVAWLYQHLMPLAPVAVASDRELDLLRQINGRMLPTILDDGAFRDAGLPMIAGKDIPKPVDWLRQLELFVSEDGLILQRDNLPDIEDYEAALTTRLEEVVDELGLDAGPVVILRAFQLVMDARSAQHSLVWESLASAFGGSAELNQEVLAWAGGSSYQLLEEVLRLFGGTSEPLPIPVGDEVLALLARLGHRMGIVEQLSLSPLVLRNWRLHSHWFDEPAGGDEITFAHLHLLGQYRHLLEFTRQGEQAILDYLKLVHDLPADLTEQDLQLIREDAAGKVALFTGFGVREILEIALEITEHGFIATLRQLDHLVRVRQACETLQLGCGAALELSHLRSNSPLPQYRTAAENALSSLVEHGSASQPPARGELGQSEASWIVVDTEVLVARAGGKARCLLTVKNFLGQPLEGITVTWHTDLSYMDAPSSLTTDANGQVENHLLAGEEMGTAQVIARYGLDRKILAPLVVIDCDDTSLMIKDPVRAPDRALAGNLEVIEYRLQILDDYGNPGRDRVVEWSTDLGTFEQPQTRGDADGFATARLRSLSSGEALVIARLPVNGEEHPYAAATFLEQQYFQYVRFSGPVAATQSVTVTSRVVNLDGSPQRNVTVLWEADVGTFSADRSITDAQGIARIEYTADEPGHVTVTVTARYNEKWLEPLSSERTRIHELPTLVEMEPAEQYFSVNQALPASFRVRVEPAVAGSPVTWWAGEELLATTMTTAAGVAAYQMRFTEEQLGEHSITVKSVRADDSFDFKVRVVVPHTRLVAQAAPDSPGIVLAEEARWVFAVDPGLSSDLLVFAERVDGVGDDDARLTFTLDSYADPAELGIVFDPPIGEMIQCDPDGKVTLKIDCTNAAFLANSDPSNNHIRLHITSNLGTSLSIWVGLRYLLDLEKSALHFFRGVRDGLDHAGLSGRIHRRNGQDVVHLRQGARRLSLILNGAAEPQETDLVFDEDGGMWLYAPSFQGEVGVIGSTFEFQAVGDLHKRVYFAGTNVYEATRIISGATLSILSDDSGMVPVDNYYVIDSDGVSRCTLELSDAEGPIEGVLLLLPGRTSISGIDFHSGGLTNAQGRTHIEVDTRNSSLQATASFPAGLAENYRALPMKVMEIAITAMTGRLTEDGKDIRATTSFTRREGRLFTHLDPWRIYHLCKGYGLLRSQAPAPEGFTISPTFTRPPALPGIMTVHLEPRTSGYVWLTGVTQVEVTEEMSPGEDS